MVPAAIVSVLALSGCQSSDEVTGTAAEHVIEQDEYKAVTSVAGSEEEPELSAENATEEEKNAVMETEVTTHSESGAEKTLDKVFLLTYEQLDEYIPDATDRQTKPTGYAAANGVYTNGSGGG